MDKTGRSNQLRHSLVSKSREWRVDGDLHIPPKSSSFLNDIAKKFCYQLISGVPTLPYALCLLCSRSVNRVEVWLKVGHKPKVTAD